MHQAGNKGKAIQCSAVGCTPQPKGWSLGGNVRTSSGQGTSHPVICPWSCKPTLLLPELYCVCLFPPTHAVQDYSRITCLACLHGSWFSSILPILDLISCLPCSLKHNSILFTHRVLQLLICLIVSYQNCSTLEVTIEEHVGKLVFLILISFATICSIVR